MINLPDSHTKYNEFCFAIERIKDNHKRYAIYRYLCRNDLFFLLFFALNRKDIYHSWLFDRIREVQENPDGYLDLWAREHYKSTIITFAKTIQDILASHGEGSTKTEDTFGIFSCTRPIAKGFLRQIKVEFENNKFLYSLFPDVIWENPKKEAPKWSEDDGLILKRQSNPKESTIEAWGMVDGQPTSKHFSVLVFDDVVTIDSVRTSSMIKTVTDSWSTSMNLGTAAERGGRIRMVGTFYHFSDTWHTIIKRGAAIPRIYPATEDGSASGKTVFISKEQNEKKRRDMGPYVYSCQMLLNPVADKNQGFMKDWLRWYDFKSSSGMNVYIIVDPASGKHKNTDYTVMSVIGLGADKNYYRLDLIRDRLNLHQRGNELMRLHRKWHPIGVGYEDVGMQADIEHIEYIQHEQNYHFDITRIKRTNVSKEDRIRKLIPIYEQGRFYQTSSMFKTDLDGKTVDLIDSFVNEEYLNFPACEHDDILDADATVIDKQIEAMFPMITSEKQSNDYGRYSRRPRRSGWAV